MDPKKRQCPETWSNDSSIGHDLLKNTFTDCRPNWANPQLEDHGIRIEPKSPQFNQPSESPSSMFIGGYDHEMNPKSDVKTQDFDPRAMLNNLLFLDQKIHQLQDLVHLIVDQRTQVSNLSDELKRQHHQLITTDLMSIIIQLISTAGSLLPSTSKILSANPLLGLTRQSDHLNSKSEQHDIEEQEMKEEDDPDEGDNIPPGLYEILQLEEEEILAPHTHFCMICGKGFKRDANLRMHMRGHGDEYKTPEALAKPHKDSSSELMLRKRYSCPFTGCKRNKDHKKFQPLKTILCVKNHYKRSHCDKSFTCSRCNRKKFSVIADLRTHEKHCGRDKWLCSCGTTFSRKDKLFGHIGLFQGHTPAISIDEPKGLAADPEDQADPTDKVVFGLEYGSSSSKGNLVQDFADVKGNVDDAGFFSPMNFDTCNLSGFSEFFLAPPFGDSDTSFSFLPSGSHSCPLKIVENSGSDGSK